MTYDLDIWQAESYDHILVKFEGRGLRSKFSHKMKCSLFGNERHEVVVVVFVTSHEGFLTSGDSISPAFSWTTA